MTAPSDSTLYNALYHVGHAKVTMETALHSAWRKGRTAQLREAVAHLRAAQQFIQSAMNSQQQLALGPAFIVDPAAQTITPVGRDSELLDAIAAMVDLPLPPEEVGRLWRFVRITHQNGAPGVWDCWIVEHDGKGYEGKTLRAAIEEAAKALPQPRLYVKPDIAYACFRCDHPQAGPVQVCGNCGYVTP